MVDGDLSVSVRSVSTRERANGGSIAHTEGQCYACTVLLGDLRTGASRGPPRLGPRSPPIREAESPREGGSDARRPGTKAFLG